MAAALVVVAVPATPAQADISDWNWTGTTSRGYDSFYGDDVVAYAAGSQASLAVTVYNDRGEDVNIKGASLEFDWGDEYTATTPPEIKADESSVITFGFTVPSTAQASNVVTHRYEVEVQYESAEDTTDGYEVEDAYLGWGDGEQMVFYLDHHPILPGTLKVRVDESATSLYSADLDRGKITFNVAPADDEYVEADYSYYRTWDEEGSDFVVYSTDQADVMDLRRQVNALDPSDFDQVPAATRELVAQAHAQEVLGDQESVAGDFAEARTYYQTALDLMTEAVSADCDVQKMNIPSIAVWLGGIGLLVLGLGGLVYAIRKPTA